MHAAQILIAVVTLAEPRAGEIPPEPGVYWEHTVEMKMGATSVPPQTMKVCLPKKQDWSKLPGQEGQGCKVSDLKRAGQRMTWKVACENGVTGEGEMTISGDSYAGTSTIRSPHGELRAAMKGRKVGGDCDAGETRRKAAEAMERHAQ